MFQDFIQPGMLGDWLNLLFSVSLVACWQVFLYWKSKTQPNYTATSGESYCAHGMG
jgi:hypothetical protein